MGGSSGQKLKQVSAAAAASSENQIASTQIAEQQKAQVQVSENAPTQQPVNNAPITQKEYNAAGFTGDDNIKDFGERAINGYTGQDYAFTNAILGGYYEEKFNRKPSSREKKEAILQEKLLNRALDKLPSRSGVTYRGMANEELKKQLLGAVGGEITMKGFQSTSVKKNVADSFAGAFKSNRVMLVVNGKSGKSIDHLSKFKGKEAEILFKSNTKFKIDRYDSKTDTFHITEIGD